MAMTLRLSQSVTEALRRRAVAERTSMQDVVHRAVDEYLRARDPETSIGVLIDAEVGRFSVAIEQLGRWPD
jgi:predicted transcriptional regulator